MTAHGNADPEDWDDWAGEDEVTGASCGTSQTQFAGRDEGDKSSRQSNEDVMDTEVSCDSLGAASNDSKRVCEAVSNDIPYISSHVLSTERVTMNNDAATARPPKSHKTSYPEVYVLLLSWAGNDDLEIDKEIEKLREVFEESYKFEITQYRIPSEGTMENVQQRIHDIIEDGGEDVLLIVYYAGLEIQSSTETGWFAQDDQSIAVPSRVDTYFLEETDADILSLYNCWRSTSAPIYHLGNIGTNQTSDLKDTLPWNKKTRGFGTASRVDGQCTVLMHLMQRFWLLGWRGTQAMDHSYKGKPTLVAILDDGIGRTADERPKAKEGNTSTFRRGHTMSTVDTTVVCSLLECGRTQAHRRGLLTSQQMTTELKKLSFKSNSKRNAATNTPGEERNDEQRRLIFITDLDASSIVGLASTTANQSSSLRISLEEFLLFHVLIHVPTWQNTIQPTGSESHERTQIYAISSAPESRSVNSQAHTTSPWILDCKEYKSWRGKQSGCLWISGSPGTGKTTAVTTIKHHFERQRNAGECVVSYFSDPDRKGVNPSIVVLARIVVKLLLRHPESNSRDALHEQLNELMWAGDHISLSRMRKIESQIRHNLGGGVRLFIFVDASDERSRTEEEQDVLSELIERLSRYDPDHYIKCIASCSRNRSEARNSTSGFRIDLNSHKENRKDLEHYLRCTLRNWKTLHEDYDTENIVQVLASKAAGVFLWARLVLQEAQLSIESRAESGKIDSTISFISNMDVYSLYERKLGRITDCDRRAALSMLRWVTYVARPLHARELVGAIFMETGVKVEEFNITKMCGGLLSIDGCGIIRFVHFSVRQYLQTRMKQAWIEVSEKANEVIAHACLKALSPENLLQSLDLPPEICSSSPDQRNQSLSFESYARSHWMFHYRLAEPASKFIAGILHDSLETSLKKSRLLVTESNSTFGNIDVVSIGLLLAARFGFSRLANLELEMGAKVDAIYEPEGLTPLIWASMAGHVDILEQLLEHDANPEFRTKSGHNAMAYAIANGHDEIVRLLLYREEAQGMDLDDYGKSSTEAENMLLKVVFKNACHACGALETVYELRCHPHTSQNCLAEGQEKFPPVVVKGEVFPQAQLDLTTLGMLCYETSIKYLRGASMYRALRVAAIHGVDDMKRILHAVGNDVEVLEQSRALSALASKLRI